MIANVNRSLIRLGKPAGSPGACSTMRGYRGLPMTQHGDILAIRLPMNGGQYLEITLRSVHNLVSVGPWFVIPGGSIKANISEHSKQ
jgi:hypothetical protein